MINRINWRYCQYAALNPNCECPASSNLLC